MKKLTALLLTVVIVLALAACGSSAPAATAAPAAAAPAAAEAPAAAPAEPVKIVVGASSTPHAEILEQVKDALAAEGYDLQIVIYDDYILPNTALEDGQLTAEELNTNIDNISACIEAWKAVR